MMNPDDTMDPSVDQYDVPQKSLLEHMAALLGSAEYTTRNAVHAARAQVTEEYMADVRALRQDCEIPDGEAMPQYVEYLRRMAALLRDENGRLRDELQAQVRRMEGQATGGMLRQALVHDLAAAREVAEQARAETDELRRLLQNALDFALHQHGIKIMVVGQTETFRPNPPATR